MLPAAMAEVLEQETGTEGLIMEESRACEDVLESDSSLEENQVLVEEQALDVQGP